MSKSLYKTRVTNDVTSVRVLQIVHFLYNTACQISLVTVPRLSLQAMKVYGKDEVQLHSYSTSNLDVCGHLHGQSILPSDKELPISLAEEVGLTPKSV